MEGSINPLGAQAFYWLNHVQGQPNHMQKPPFSGESIEHNGLIIFLVNSYADLALCPYNSLSLVIQANFLQVWIQAVKIQISIKNSAWYLLLMLYWALIVYSIDIIYIFENTLSS